MQSLFGTVGSQKPWRACISGFNGRHPDITVKITNSIASVDFDRDDLGLAIQPINGA